MRGRIAGVVLAVVMLAGPAAAQRGGMVEASLLMRGTLFDASFQRTEVAIGFGGRVGAYLGSHWLVEADYSASSPKGIDYWTLHAHVNYLAPFQEGGLMVAGLGVVRNRYAGAVRGTDMGASGIFGFRWEIAWSFFVRFDGTLDFITSPANGAGTNWNSGVHFAAGYRFGRRQAPVTP